MVSSSDVHVRICGQEIIQYDLEIKALIQDIVSFSAGSTDDLNSTVKEVQPVETGNSATYLRTVQETNEEFKAMTGTIHLGRKLIRKYNRHELTDRLLIFLAITLFLATVLYTLKKTLPIHVAERGTG